MPACPLAPFISPLERAGEIAPRKCLQLSPQQGTGLVLSPGSSAGCSRSRSPTEITAVWFRERQSQPASQSSDLTVPYESHSR